MYVMCICLISYSLGCEVDLSRSFMTLGGLPSLYKWKYVRVNVLNGDSCTWTCINWVVLSQAVSASKQELQLWHMPNVPGPAASCQV
jgi:hypothetical protein